MHTHMNMYIHDIHTKQAQKLIPMSKVINMMDGWTTAPA